MQQLFPLIFVVICISIPAAVNVYFIVSSLFRGAQQEFIYRREPKPQTSSSCSETVQSTRATRQASGVQVMFPNSLFGSNSQI